MMYPLVGELAVDGVPVTVMCRVLNLARQPYYRWLACPVTESEWREAHRRRWASRDELRIAIITWIERTYHRRRRQDSLGRLTPVEYEAIMTAPASQAA